MRSMVGRRDGVIEVVGSRHYILWFHSLPEKQNGTVHRT